MNEPIYGLDEPSAKLFSEIAFKHRQRLPDVGRRTRRVGPSGKSGAIKVIGECTPYTPDIGDPDTDYEEEYPGGCDGPNVLAVNVLNVSSGVTTVKRLEVESTGPLTLASDTFSFNCRSGSRNIYIKVVFNSLSIQGVVATIYNASDDSVLQTFTNTVNSWDPLAGGNLQNGPDDTSCDCGTLDFNLCFSVPTR